MRKDDIVRFIRPVKIGQITVAKNTRARVLETPKMLSSQVFVQVEGYYEMKVRLSKSELVRLGKGR